MGGSLNSPHRKNIKVVSLPVPAQPRRAQVVAPLVARVARHCPSAGPPDPLHGPVLPEENLAREMNSRDLSIWTLASLTLSYLVFPLRARPKVAKVTDVPKVTVVPTVRFRKPRQSYSCNPELFEKLSCESCGLAVKSSLDE